MASIGQADDVALLSSDPHRLFCLLHLAMEYASEHHVEMVPSKTKLLCFTPRGKDDLAYYQKLTSPISMGGKSIPFSDDAEHVGIIRSTHSGNMPNVLSRQSAHSRALFSVLPCGLARNHTGNPAAAL